MQSGDKHVFNSEAQLDLGDDHWCHFRSSDETDVQRPKKTEWHFGISGNNEIEATSKIINREQLAMVGVSKVSGNQIAT